MDFLATNGIRNNFQFLKKFPNSICFVNIKIHTIYTAYNACIILNPTSLCQYYVKNVQLKLPNSFES